jgi:SH3 domain-containing YSC84-like protein 1
MNKKYMRAVTITGASALLAAMCSLTPLVAADDKTEQDRVKEAGEVLKELMTGPNGIPLSVLNKSECVVVLPSVKKGGFIVAGSYGRGIMSCRSEPDFSGNWSAPIMMQSTGGSFGLQAGGQAIDYVVLVMNDKGARGLMNGKVKMGADASVAAGPVGRDAEAATSGAMSAELLSYSRTQGAFAGVSLSGTTFGPDSGANEKLYGKKMSGGEIYKGGVTAPASAQVFLATLAEKSPKNVSRGK